MKLSTYGIFRLGMLKAAKQAMKFHKCYGNKHMLPTAHNIVSRLEPAQTLTPCLFKINFNISPHMCSVEDRTNNIQYLYMKCCSGATTQTFKIDGVNFVTGTDLRHLFIYLKLKFNLHKLQASKQFTLITSIQQTLRS